MNLKPSPSATPPTHCGPTDQYTNNPVWGSRWLKGHSGEKLSWMGISLWGLTQDSGLVLAMAHGRSWPGMDLAATKRKGQSEGCLQDQTRASDSFALGRVWVHTAPSADSGGGTGNHRNEGLEKPGALLAKRPSLSFRLFGTRVSCLTTRHREYAPGTSKGSSEASGTQQSLVGISAWVLSAWINRQGATKGGQLRLKNRAPAETHCWSCLYKRPSYLIFPLTSFLSFRLVTITMVAVFCSQIILQKSFTVSSFGPKAANSKNEGNTWQGEERCWEMWNIHSWLLETYAHISLSKDPIHWSIHPPANWTFPMYPPCMCQVLH